MSDPMTPRQLNQKLKDGKVYWLRYKDLSQLRVHKAVSRYDAVYVQTAAGWIRADQVESDGEKFSLTAESKPKKESFFRFDDRKPSKGETQ